MNKYVIVSLVATISLFLGYNLYPILNEVKNSHNTATKHSHTQSNKEQPSTLKATKILNPSNNETSSLAANSLDSKKIKAANTSKSTTYDNAPNQKATQSNSATQNDYQGELAEVEILEAQAELQQWSVSHKKKLEELLIYNLDTDIAQELMKQIMVENPFLNDSTVKQEAARDEEWAFKMTQLINNLISEHPNGFEIEVLSLTCKQLTCEILVRQLVNGSWFEIYPALIQHFLSNRFIVQTEDMKQFMFKNGEEYIFYQHLNFGEQN